MYNLLREKCTSPKKTLSIFSQAANTVVISPKTKKWHDSSSPQAFLMCSSRHVANVTTTLMAN